MENTPAMTTDRVQDLSDDPVVVRADAANVCISSASDLSCSDSDQDDDLSGKFVDARPVRFGICVLVCSCLCLEIEIPTCYTETCTNTPTSSSPPQLLYTPNEVIDFIGATVCRDTT